MYNIKTIVRLCLIYLFQNQIFSVHFKTVTWKTTLRHQFSTVKVKKTWNVSYSVGMTSIFTLLMSMQTMEPNSEYIVVSSKWGITKKYVFLPDVITFKDTISSEIVYTISVLYHNLWPMNREILSQETGMGDVMMHNNSIYN